MDILLLGKGLSSETDPARGKIGAFFQGALRPPLVGRGIGVSAKTATLVEKRARAC